MNAPPDKSKIKGPVSLTQALVKTLNQERETLMRMDAHFKDQIEAIRTREKEILDDATHKTDEEVNTLSRLRQSRERHVRLLGRVLRIETEQVSIENLASALQARSDCTEIGQALATARAQVREQAMKTQERCEELEFTLQYAVELGREMMHAVQGLDLPAPAQGYTSAGNAAPSSNPRSFLNKVG